MRMSLFQMLATGYQAQKEGAMERSVERRGIPHSFGKTANKMGEAAVGTLALHRCSGNNASAPVPNYNILWFYGNRENHNRL